MLRPVEISRTNRGVSVPKRVLQFQLPVLALKLPTHLPVSPRPSQSKRTSGLGSRRNSISRSRAHNSMDLSLIDVVVAERRHVDVSLLSARDRKVQFPFPKRVAGFQTAIGGARTRIRERTPERQLRKTEAGRLIRELNWINPRLDSFFPQDSADRMYRGPGKTLYHHNDGRSVWVPATVLDYDESRVCFLIQLDTLKPPLTKSVQRVNLMFPHDDEATFLSLLTQAHALKSEADQRMNFDLFIAEKFSQNYALDGIPRVFLTRIIQYIGRIWSDFGEEKKRNWIRDLNAFYDYAYLKGVLYDRWDEEEVTVMRVQEGITHIPKTEKWRPQVLVSDIHFKDSLNTFKTMSLFSNPTVYKTLFSLRAIHSQMSDSETIFQSLPTDSSWVRFLQSRGSKSTIEISSFPTNLLAFFKYQKFRVLQAKAFIEKVWVHQLACQIQDSKSIVGNVRDRVSKLTELTIQELVRDHILLSLDKFQELVSPGKRPIFQVEVEFSHDGKNQSIEIELHPAPDRILTIVDYILESILRLKDGIPKIQSWTELNSVAIERERTYEEIARKTKVLRTFQQDVEKLRDCFTHLETFGHVLKPLPGRQEDVTSPRDVLSQVSVLESHMSQLSQTRTHILTALSPYYRAGIFQIDSSKFLSFLLELVRTGMEQGHEQLHSVLLTYSALVEGVCQQVTTELELTVNSIDDLIEAISSAKRIKECDYPQIWQDVMEVSKGLVRFEWVWSEADNSNAEALYVLHTRLHKVQTLITNRLQSLETDIPKYIRKLEQEKELLKIAVKALYTRYQEFIQIPISASQNLEKWMTDCAVLAASLISQTNEVEATRKKINYRESVLGMETSKQYLLDKLVASSPVVLQFSLKSAEIHQNLQIWKNTPLKKIDPDNIAASLLTIKAEFITSLPKLASSQQQIATSLCSDFDTFLTYISVANLLKEPSLKERHWKQICTVLELASDSYLDLGAVVTKSGHLPPKLDGIRSIIEIAIREQGIETQLRENQHRFNAMTFTLTQFNDTWLLTGQDFIRDKIVEFRELLRHITEQQCAQELKLRAVEWTKRLDILELLTEEWTKAQDLMLQIHSLFLTPESRSGNFATFSEYQKLISRLTKILVEIQEQPQVLRCREMHIKYFQSCSHQLHVLSSSLSPVQEDDGQFYALSDSQMLQLLSSEE